MDHKDRRHYAKKHSPDQKRDTAIAQLLEDRSSNGEISCTAAFEIAEELGSRPSEVGVNADLLEIRVIKCQLGLHGYRPNKKIVKPSESTSEDLVGAIRQALEDERLPCRSAWNIAKRLSIGRMEVSSACEALGVKISSCQLGAF